MTNSPKDMGGWVHGVTASLKQAFSTDTELHIRSNIHEEIKDARRKVDLMTASAEHLLVELNRYSEQVDPVELALQDIVKDL